MEGEWMTIQDVSEYLKVDPETVRRWVRSGELKALSLGQGNRSGYRILKSELEMFIAARYGYKKASQALS